MERPSVLQIESTARCNAKCSFCPVGLGLERPVGEMSDELVDKILADAHALGIDRVLLFLNGEPFIFKRFFGWLHKLRHYGMKTHVFTNGASLTRDKADQLASFHDVVELVCFSVSGKDAESQRRIMNLDFDRVIQNIRYFANDANYNGFADTTIIKQVYVSMPNIEGTAYQNQWKQLWAKEGIKAQVNPNFNWGGRVGHDKGGFTSYCGRLDHMTVLWDGRVNLCCMDGHGEVILGDLNHQTISEVYNGEVAKHYRSLHTQGRQSELKLCDICTMR